jgi:hypothetical protein
MDPLKFIVGTLAVWRLTYLLAAEDGPFYLLARLRRRLGSGSWGGLMDCFYCLSIWIAIPFAIWLGGLWIERLIICLALSGAAILVNRVIDRFVPEPPIFFEEPKRIEEEHHELLRKI